MMVEELRPKIQSIVDNLIDNMIKHGCESPLDLVKHFSMPIPYLTIAHILGVPEKDTAKLIEFTAVRSNGSSTARAASQASQDLVAYMKDLVAGKSANPSDDLISKLVVDYMRAGMLSAEDVTQIAFLLLVAGNATVAGITSLGVVTLLQHPTQLHELRMNPMLSPNCVEELCRYHTASSLATRRIALQDVLLGGKVIKKHEGLILSNESANRDESIFPDPDKFDIHRPLGKQLGFGYGIHRCVAERLAKAELEVVFATLFQRLPKLRVAIPFEQIHFGDPHGDVGIAELPVTF